MPGRKHTQRPFSGAMAHLDRMLDEALEGTFPASDPVAINIDAGGYPGRYETAAGSEQVELRKPAD